MPTAKSRIKLGLHRVDLIRPPSVRMEVCLCREHVWKADGTDVDTVTFRNSSAIINRAII